MFGFKKHAPDARCGLLVDIGSASVAVAIVITEPDELQPTIVWTHTERCPISETYTISTQAKRIVAALTNVSLEIGSAGLKALAQHEPAMRITTTQVSIAAPWSYTVPKRVTYSADEPFLVTQKLLADLNAAAERETVETFGKLDLFNELGLETLSGDTHQYVANGYSVNQPPEQTLQKLTLIRDITIAQKQLVDAVREIHQAVVPRSELKLQSFMQELQSETLRHTIQERTYGMVDISGEASEVGIVRDGQLQTVINNEHGYNDLVRGLSSITQQPSTSAFALLQSSSDSTISTLTETQRKQWDQQCTDFVTTIADLIGRTAAMSELPEHYTLHTDTTLRPLMMTLLKRAIAMSTGEATVSLVSEKLLDITSVDETRLALSIAVFHKPQLKANGAG